MFRMQGPLGNLYISDKHRSKGLGMLLFKAIGKSLGDNDEDTFAYVLKDNIISIKMMEKIGFVYSDDIRFVITELIPRSRL